MPKELIIPAGDYLLLDMKEQKYEGRLIIPETAKDAPIAGVVMAVGPGKWDKDIQAYDTLVSKVGDRVLFGKYAGAEIEWEGKKLLLIHESDVIAYIQEVPNA
jgi:chaperonin GroES